MNSIESQSHCNESVSAELFSDLLARKPYLIQRRINRGDSGVVKSSTLPNLPRVTADRDRHRIFNPLHPSGTRLFCGFSNILCPDCARPVPNLILREGA